MRGRLVLAIARDVPIPHGLTEGKRYRFRGDCGECLAEAWERMTYGGLHVNPAHRITAAVPIGRGADGHAMIWELWHAPR